MVSTSPSIRARSGNVSFARLHLMSLGLKGEPQKSISPCLTVPPAPSGHQHSILAASTHLPFETAALSLQGYLLPDQVMDGHVRQRLDQGALWVITLLRNCTHQSGGSGRAARTACSQKGGKKLRIGPQDPNGTGRHLGEIAGFIIWMVTMPRRGIFFFKKKKNQFIKKIYKKHQNIEKKKKEEGTHNI